MHAFLVSIWIASSLHAHAQDTVPQPGDNAAQRAQEPEHAGRQSSYEAVAVVPPSGDDLREEHRIGEYEQPRWTAHRRFPTTRIYVIPEGQFDIEWWLEMKLSLEDTSNVRYRSQYELEFGLGYRLQLDIYLQTEQEGHDGSFHLREEKFELRWAIADWGDIPLNPTLYFEFARAHEAPPKIEMKILIGEEFTRRLHWGLNLVFEHELGGEQENEYAITTGLSYTVVDEVLSVGLELQFETVDRADHRFAGAGWEFLGGPSVSWSPSPALHVLFTPLFGIEDERDETTLERHATPLFEPLLILGWEA